MKARSGKPFTSEQVKRLIPGYRAAYNKGNGTMGKAIRRFIEAIA
jgi:hypothetical protein